MGNKGLGFRKRAERRWFLGGVGRGSMGDMGVANKLSIVWKTGRGEEKGRDEKEKRESKFEGKVI